jgi:hypothetical protein
MAAATKTAGHRSRHSRPGDVGPATKTDQEHFRRQAARADAGRGRAYKAGTADGKAGTPDAHRPLEAELDDYYDQGYTEGSRSRPSPPAGAGADDRAPSDAAGARPKSPSSSSSSSSAGGGAGPFSSLSVTEDGAGFLVGALAYALILNYLRYGWPGVTGWLSAKFINKVTLGKTAAPTGGVSLVPNANPAASSPGSPAPAPQAGGMFT